MLKIGDYVVLKPDLVLGRKYGTVTFGKYHVPYLHKLLRVYKISSTGTVYCNYNGNPCDCGTISESMLNIAKFRVGDIVKIIDFSVANKQQPYVGREVIIKSVKYRDNYFVYRIVNDCGVFDWPENKLENLQLVLKNENKLQREDSNLRSGERVQGSRVHGRKSQASIRSRPLRDPSRIRGK